jgi:heptosyltransferase-2
VNGRPIGAALAIADVRRVLVRFPNWLGDTVMALPALRALQAARPALELWCVGRWVVPLLEAEPGLAQRLDYPRDWRGRLRLAGHLRRASLDLALLLPNSFEAALAARLAGARRRVGYAGDGRTPLLTDPVVAPAQRVHQVAAYLALLAPLGIAASAVPPTLHVDERRRAEARRLLATVGVRRDDRPVAIQLGAALGPSKLWPPARLAALAARLGERDIPVVFLGDTTADPLIRAVEAASPARPRSLVGRDHPALLPALLAEFAVVVAPDSGPAHVAAAVGVPVVALFGPTDPRLTAPLGEGHAALWRRPACAPCFLSRCPIDHRCLTALAVDEVVDAVLARR